MRPRVTLNYVVVTFLVVVISWLLHELSHYTMGRFLGYSMVMTLNSTYPEVGETTLRDATLISAAGPLFTILQAVIAFYLLKRFADSRLYTVLFIAFYMRLLALVVSFNNPNDEARISMAFGIGMFTLPILVSVLLFFLVYRASRQQKYTIRFQTSTAVLTLLFSSGLIILDQLLHVTILS